MKIEIISISKPIKEITPIKAKFTNGMIKVKEKICTLFDVIYKEGGKRIEERMSREGNKVSHKYRTVQKNPLAVSAGDLKKYVALLPIDQAEALVKYRFGYNNICHQTRF